MAEAFSPLVSVVIPVYRGSDFLTQAIDSVLSQTYTNLEIIVVNDGSNDGDATEAVALAYGHRIRYFSKPNGGVATALNRAIAEARGDYISWLSHDDLYTPNKLATQIAHLSALPVEVRANTILYSDFAIFTDTPEAAVRVRLPETPPAQFRYWITTVSSLHGCTLLIPKAAFVQCGNFNEALRTTQDYDLWFRMAEHFRFVHQPECLVYARQHAAQGSVALSDIARQECNALLSHFARALSHDELRLSSATLSLAYARIAASMWARNFRSAGLSASRLLLRHASLSEPLQTLRAFALLLQSLLLYLVLNPLRARIAPVTRRRIKNMIHCGRTITMQALKRALPAPLKRRLLALVRPAHSVAPTPSNRSDHEALHQLDLREKFSRVYEKNLFEGAASRSGNGSDLEQTARLRTELPALLKRLEVKTLLDAPCGDWYWMQKVDLPVLRYIGVDIVPALIAKNTAAFGNEKHAFHCLDLAKDALPEADLIFSRDCLVHLSFADALTILHNFKRSGATYLLTTSFTERNTNADLGDGFWRPINLERAPFHFPPPIEIINENCSEAGGKFADKSLALWRLADILPQGAA
jgi:glycosyltransferase involved in cell wall biosynthesis